MSLNRYCIIILRLLILLGLKEAIINVAEKIEKSNKLLRIQIDLGAEKRTVLSGIAKQYEPEDIVGRQVQVVINLKPRKIMGELSEGMILMAEDKEGNLTRKYGKYRRQLLHQLLLQG